MIRKLNIVEGRLVESQLPSAQILVFVNPDEAQRKQLIEEYRLDEHTLASALDPDELSRLEFEPDHVAMIFKRPRNYSSTEQFLFKVVSAGMFLFKDKLILVLSDDVTLFEGRQFAKVSSLIDLVLKLIYRSIFHYEEHLKVINAISNELEGQISTAMENRHLLNLFTLEKSLVYYVNAISSNARLIEKLRNNSAKIGLSVDNLEFVDDLLIENSQCYEQANIYSQVLSGLMDARVSIVSNNLNLLMKTLTLVMIAIMTPTLVISVFSMNVRLPVEQETSSLSFWIVMALAMVSIVAVLWVWKRKKL